MTLSRMTLSRMTLSRMTLSRMTKSRITLSTMTLSSTTFSKMTFSKMTFSEIPLPKWQSADQSKRKWILYHFDIQNDTAEWHSNEWYSAEWHSVKWESTEYHSENSHSAELLYSERYRINVIFYYKCYYLYSALLGAVLQNVVAPFWRNLSLLCHQLKNFQKLKPSNGLHGL